jgi:putative component of toxin-antitoxin plasmid stabilization module
MRRVVKSEDYRAWIDGLRDLAGRGEQLLLLLYGGSKATQTNDIARALDLNRTFEDHTP